MTQSKGMHGTDTTQANIAHLRGETGLVLLRARVAGPVLDVTAHRPADPTGVAAARGIHHAELGLLKGDHLTKKKKGKKEEKKKKKKKR